MANSILDQILTWADNRPEWQRDALRRLFQQGSFSHIDLQELTQICRRGAGLDVAESTPTAKPLDGSALSGNSNGISTVALAAVAEIKNINALAPDQKLSFADTGMTVIYGDNGAGKSGYARILKHACRARGNAATILSDVFETADSTPSAEISFLVGQKAQIFAWSPDSVRPDALRDVSVFDTATATVYVDERTDVAFRPFGLDVFPKLAGACDHLRSSLQAELAALGSPRSFPDMAGQHEVGTAIADLQATQSIEKLTKLAEFSDEDEELLVALRRQVAALDVDAPSRRAAEGKLRIARLTTFHSRLTKIHEALKPDRLSELAQLRAQMVAATEAATAAKSEAAGYAPEWKIGSTAWQVLWNAAKKYAEEGLQRESPFFDTSVDTSCALCKQPISAEAADRMQSFSNFAAHEAFVAEAASTKAFEDAISEMRALSLNTGDDEPILEELRSLNSPVAEATQGLLLAAAELREHVVSALSDGSTAPSSNLPSAGIANLMQLITREELDVGALAAASEPSAAQAVRQAFAALDARKRLQDSLPEVIAEHVRLAQRKSLAQAIRQTETAGITTKNTELTKAGVSEQLRERFQTELNSLRLDHLTVSVEPQHGAKGVTFHQVRFVNAKSAGWSASEVLSEGEQRCIALAGFLAEVSTQPAKSGVVFDDPVSSLDHERRGVVATRLTHESKSRQVIVFTHDLVFLLFLEEECKRQGVSWKTTFLTHRGTKRGVPVEGLPWYGQTLKQRIGWLRNQVQQQQVAAKTIDKEQIEPQAAMLWGRLREAWECGVEEVLLGGAVKRFSRKVSTQQLKHVADITDADIQAVEEGMTVCSTWMPGHDLAAAVNQPMPTLQALSNEIEKLESWRKAIDSRRK